MTYILLLLTILLIWAVVYPLTDHALLSPPSLILIMMAFATFLAFIGCAYWNEIELSLEAYFVVTVGCLGVLVAAIVARSLFIKKDNQNSKKLGVAAIAKIADISAKRWLILSIFVIIAAAINVREMVILAQNAGYSGTDFMDIAQWARGNVASLLTSGSSESEESYSALSSGLTKIITFCGYAAVIGIAAKIKCQQRSIREYVAVAFLLMLASSFSLMKGGRDTVAHYIAAFLIVLFAFYLIDSKNKGKTSLKFLKIGVIAVAFAIPLFYLALELVGRTRSVSLIDYTSFYFGGGIPSLSYAIEHFSTNINETLWGEKSFAQFYALLNKVGIIGPVDAYADNFIKLKGHSSNIYTCFYRYYYDFGYLGIFLLSGLSTLTFCLCFHLLKNNPHITVKIVTVYVCSYTADVAREEFVFSRLLSASLLWAVIAAVFIGVVLMYKRRKRTPIINSAKTDDSLMTLDVS